MARKPETAIDWIENGHKETVRKLRAKIRKLKAREISLLHALSEKPKAAQGKVIARGWFCPKEKNAGIQGTGAHDVHMVLPRACFCQQEERCFKGCIKVHIIRS